MTHDQCLETDGEKSRVKATILATFWSIFSSLFSM